MKLAIATMPTFFVEEDKIITRLFEEGLDYLFLYKEYAHPQFMERLLNLIPKKYHSHNSASGISLNIQNISVKFAIIRTVFVCKADCFFRVAVKLTCYHILNIKSPLNACLFERWYMLFNKRKHRE